MNNDTVKTIDEINEKIKRGDVVVVTAEEMPDIVDDLGPEKAAKEVDVVTTGTFGAMCSSGAFLNFGHADPPIKMARVWLNNVEAYTGIAAVDAYIGATQPSTDRFIEYGGGHVIEDLVRGREIELRAEAYYTDCYPRTYVETVITIHDLNQAIMVNPRNAYQRYNAATNSTDRVLYTYMGTLLPRFENVTYATAGELSPLINDPDYETIGIGTRIFLGGGIGYIIGEGTQHNPKVQFGTLMVRGDLKKMDPRFLRGATMHKYGCTLFVGIGIPIPILNPGLAKKTAIRDEDIIVNVVDYGIPKLNRPVVARVTYEELESGRVEINGVEARTSSLTSRKMAREIAETLKRWIEEGRFFLTEPLERLPRDTEFKPMKLRKGPLVRDYMTKHVITARPDQSIEEVARLLVRYQVDHLPIVDEQGKLLGIVTSWDIAKAVAQGKRNLEEIMTRNVITATPDETLDSVSLKFERYNIHGVPVVDEQGRVVGIITASDVSRAMRRG